MVPGGPGDWQFEADLLAEGRQALERFSRSRRFRYLYPEGPSLALLLLAYQELDRLRTVGRVRGGLRRQARAMRRIVARVAREDAIGRTRRLQYRYPTPRAHQILAPPDLVRRALRKVDADARRLVETRLFGQRAVPDPSVSMASEAARESRGMAQFRDALVNEALAAPAALVRLHPQYLLFAATPPPTRRHHPIATFLLVKLPLQLVGALLTLLVVGYVGAWAVFNDEVLGDFVSDRVSGLVEGELRMGSIHWDLPLVYDLVTGRPSHVVVEDVTVWEPYASYGGERLRRAAHADRLEVKIVLHEIIPWNRLGIPRALDIPWVLHFTDVKTDDAAWFSVRQYVATNDAGVERRLIGLRDAFQPVKPPDPNRRGLSFAVDQASLARVELDLDFEDTAEWRTQLVLDWANFGLRFDAPPVGFENPLELPLVVWLEALGRHGAVRIKGLEVPLSDIEITRFASGLGGTPRADVALSGTVDAAGSPLTLHGVLGRALARDEPTDPYGDLTTVNLSASTPDGGPLVDQILREMQLPPTAFVAEGAPVTATIEGPLTDPRYEIAVQGAAIDPLDEPAWTATDVALSAVIEPGEVPERFADPDAPTALPQRKIVTFDTLRGDVLHGAFGLNRGTPATIVIPEDEGEPWRIAVDLALDGIDPALLRPEDPEAAAVLGGRASGHLDVRQLVLAPPSEIDPEASTLRLAELMVEDFTLLRDRGPADDGLPQRIDAEGRVRIDETGAIDLSELRLSTDGGFVEIDGGVDGDLQRVKETLLRVRIDRGPAFSRALGLDDYFDTLRAELTVAGPLFSPSSTTGNLHVTGVGDPGAPATDATIRLDRGTLHVRTDNAHLFGSTGRVDAQVVLFANGELLSEPRLKADVALAGVKIEELLGADAGVSGIVDVALTIDDGHGRPTPIDRLTIAGKARAAKLRFGGTLYRGAEIEFTLLPESLRIDRLVLPIHRPVSPLSAPDLTVPIGEVVASGTVGLRKDPSLDLAVTARGVPVGVVARLLDLDVPMRGQIAQGTDLQVGGTVARPKVEGTVRLEGLSSSGLLLGSGQLEVTSADFAAEGPLAAHRELRARGELATSERERGRLQWTVDAVVAIGETRGRDRPPVDAEVDVSFDRLSISTLLTAADPTADDPAVSGRLEGVGGHVLACNDGAPMLSACMDASARPALAVDLQVDRAWISGEALPESTTDPCAHVTTLCSENRLDARLDWPLVELARPWTLRMGDAGAATLEVTGGLDLSGDDPAPAAPGPPAAMEVKCRPPAIAGPAAPGSRKPRRTSSLPDRGPRAEVRGVVDLRALGPLLREAGITIEQGRLDVDLSIAGRLGDPRVGGRITLAESDKPGKGESMTSAPTGDPIVLSVPGVTLPLEIRDLDLRVVGDWLAAAGTLAVGGEELDFGSVRGEHTGLGLSGPCAGRFAGAGEGAVSATLLNALAGRTVAPKGSVEVRRLSMAGSTASGLDRAETSLRFGSRALELELTEGLEDVEITGGVVDLALCTPESCPAMPEGTIAVHIAGANGADDRERPAQALAARVGPRGRAFAWGRAYLAPDLSHFESSDVVVQLRDVPYRDYDSRGRSVFELEASSDAVRLQGGDPLVVSGTIDLGRARYVKDAIEGVNLLAFTDSVDVPEAPPPEIMRTVQLDLRVQTEQLARIENNIAHRVEARLAVDVTGTYEHPELAGRIDIEPGGTVDIPFVTGTYEIQRGRVDLVGDLGDAEVDVLALRLEPIYVEGSARRISLLLGGTVSAITWDCIVAGDTTGAAETQRGCLDYLVLGAGDVALDTDVQRLGGGGLTNARKPLQVVGHVTEFDFGKRIEDAAPRYRSYVPNVKARLGQIGPELVIASPEEWLDFDYGHATFGWHYTRGYPGFLLRQSRELTLRLEILDPVSVEYSRDNRDYLNERIVFDPLQQRTIELRFDFEIPSLR